MLPENEVSLEEHLHSIKSRIGLKKGSIKNDSLIQQKKFVYSDTCPLMKFENLNDFGPKIISDCLARIFNCLRKNQVTSICFSFSKDDSNKQASKIQIDKLNFSSKKQSLSQKDTIKKILDYFFEKTSDEINFIDSISEKFSRLVQNLKENDKLDQTLKERLDFFEMNNEKIKNNQILDLFFELMESNDLNLQTNESSNRDYKIDLYYLMVFFCDFLFLKDILMRHYSLSNDFEIEEIFALNNTHPDIQIARKIHSSNENLQKYVGVSQLCCAFCSIYIDFLDLDFRGIAKKYEKNWQLPSNLAPSSFKSHLNTFSNIVSQHEPPFTVSFIRNRLLDRCQNASVTVSDDLCLFLDYYTQNNFGVLNLIIAGFNINNTQDLVKFIESLRKKFKSSCTI